MPDDKPILAFETQAAFRAWLRENHAGHSGIWLRYFKKASARSGIKHIEAVEEALCWGWIDGQARPCDEISWLVKFTPRGKKSLWSQVNVGHVGRLIREGRMQPSGFATVETAKADGRWQAAYASSSTFEMPADFMAELAKRPDASASFQALAKANRYAIYFHLHTAKRPETRARRMREFIAELERGGTIRG